MSLIAAAELLGISPTALKRACRKVGVRRWAQVDVDMDRESAQTEPQASNASGGLEIPGPVLLTASSGVTVTLIKRSTAMASRSEGSSTSLAPPLPAEDLSHLNGSAGSRPSPPLLPCSSRECPPFEMQRASAAMWVTAPAAPRIAAVYRTHQPPDLEEDPPGFTPAGTRGWALPGLLQLFEEGLWLEVPELDLPELD
jgi:hypothetical protein